MSVIETTTITQIIECADEQQARDMGEYLIQDGDVMSFGDTMLDDIEVVVEPVRGYSEVDFDQYDVDEAIGN